MRSEYVVPCYGVWYSICGSLERSHSFYRAGGSGHYIIMLYYVYYVNEHISTVPIIRMEYDVLCVVPRNKKYGIVPLYNIVQYQSILIAFPTPHRLTVWYPG